MSSNNACLWYWWSAPIGDLNANANVCCDTFLHRLPLCSTPLPLPNHLSVAKSFLSVQLCALMNLNWNLLLVYCVDAMANDETTEHHLYTCYYLKYFITYVNLLSTYFVCRLRLLTDTSFSGMKVGSVDEAKAAARSVLSMGAGKVCVAILYSVSCLLAWTNDLLCIPTTGIDHIRRKRMFVAVRGRGDICRGRSIAEREGRTADASSKMYPRVVHWRTNVTVTACAFMLAFRLHLSPF